MAEQYKFFRQGWFSKLFRAAPESALNGLAPTLVNDSYFTATADGLMMVNLSDGIILKANPAAETLLGYTPDALTGVHFSKVLPPSTANQNTALQHRFRGVTGVSEGQAFCRLDGSEIPCDLLMTVIQDGQRALAIMHLRDASEREARQTRQHEAVSLHAETEAHKESTRQKDMFMSKLAHQLRTPLAVIHSAASMVSRYHDRLTVEKRLEHLLRIQTHAHLAAVFIEDLRFLNHAEAGEVKLHLEQRDLSELTQLALKPYHAHINQPQITFVSSSETPVSARVDELLYLKLVDKLVSNAVVYSPPASALSLSLSQNIDGVALTVTDLGIGIPPDFLPHACDPYQRGANIGDVDGMGMGLAVAQACVRLMDGDLTLDSVLGAGTTAKIRLPSSP